MYQQLWGYKVEEKLYLGVREQKRLNTTGLYILCPNRIKHSCSLNIAVMAAVPTGVWKPQGGCPVVKLEVLVYTPLVPIHHPHTKTNFPTDKTEERAYLLSPCGL
jgi:hypothetical protein